MWTETLDANTVSCQSLPMLAPAALYGVDDRGDAQAGMRCCHPLPVCSIKRDKARVDGKLLEPTKFVGNWRQANPLTVVVVELV